MRFDGQAREERWWSARLEVAEPQEGSSGDANHHCLVPSVPIKPDGDFLEVERHRSDRVAKDTFAMHWLRSPSRGGCGRRGPRNLRERPRAVPPRIPKGPSSF